MSIIWANKVDKKYEVIVRRNENDTHRGTLIMVVEGKELRQEVTISYGGPFGPDAGDVSRWCDIACDFVDKVLSEQNQ